MLTSPSMGLQAKEQRRPHQLGRAEDLRRDRERERHAQVRAEATKILGPVVSTGSP